MTRRLLTPLLLLPASLLAQQPMHLTLADAQRIAIQNNPQYSSAKYTAAAVHQEPAQYRAAELPSLGGLLTGVAAARTTAPASPPARSTIPRSTAAPPAALSPAS